MPPKPAARSSAKPAARSSAKPAGRSSAKPSPKAAAKPSTRPAAKPSTKPAVKPSPRPAAKPSTKPAVKPSPRPAVKPSPRPAARPSTRPAAKPSTRPTVKPSPRPTVEPSPRPAARPNQAAGDLADTEAALRAHALAKPEATEHFPWGERAIKVNGKVFLFMYADATRLSLSTKLPDSSGVALMLPFAKPTGYGLGKAGWVSASFERADKPPIEMLCAWIDESYQAVAPAKLASVARGASQPPRPRGS